MSAQFDSYTLSLSVDQTLDEFLKYSQAMGGMRIWETPGSDREKAISFRHEFAHFSSYVASGLADLVGIFFDYKIAFLDSIINYAVDKGGPTLQMPIITGRGDDCLTAKEKTIITAAFNDINSLLGYYVGLGSELTFRKMFDLHNQTRFWARFWKQEYDPAVRRFYSLITSHTLITEDNYLDIPAMPAIDLPQGTRLLSSRSVIEAYALTIELINRHFKGLYITTAATRDQEMANVINVTRPIQVGEHYSLAIQYFLSFSGLFNNTTLDMFLAGAGEHDSYYALLYVSFAALQIPLLHLPVGETLIRGDIRDLSPCTRFFRIVNALRDNKIRLPDTSFLEMDDKAALAFLSDCNTAIGDPMTIAKYQHMADIRAAMDKKMADNPNEKKYPDLIELSINAHANFFAGPADFVKEGGLFSFKHYCEVGYILTSDNKLISPHSNDKAFFEYLNLNRHYLFEAAVFERLWDSTVTRVKHVAEKDIPVIIQVLYCSRGTSDEERDALFNKLNFKKRS